MQTDTTTFRIPFLEADGLAAGVLCWVGVLVAFGGFLTSSSWMSWLVFLPLMMLFGFVLVSLFVSRADVKLVDAINLDTLLTLTRDGLYDHSADIFIDWANVRDVTLSRKMHRKYEIRAELHLELLGSTGASVHRIDVSRLTISSRRVFEMVRYRIQSHSELTRLNAARKDGLMKSEKISTSV